MKKRGRKEGQSGARVRRIGDSGVYALRANFDEFEAQWNRLNELSNVSGAASREVLTAYKNWMEQHTGDLQTETNQIVKKILEIVETGVIIQDGETTVNDVGQGQLKSLVSSLMS